MPPVAANGEALTLSPDTAAQLALKNSLDLQITAANIREAQALLQSGALEASNVDITTQLVNMITAQRNFQANAQMISTADQITQTIINIR